MSLKIFHVVFISIATLLAIFFGFWAVNSYMSNNENNLHLFLGVISFILAIVLIVYEIRIAKKIKV